MVKNRANCDTNVTTKNLQGHLASPEENINSVNNVKLTNELFYSNIHVVEDECDPVYEQDKFVETPILDALEHYTNNHMIPLHIPGHAKGSNGIHPKFRKIFGQNIIDIDTTDEFDNLGTLHPSDGPIAKSQELTAQLFGASKSFFLINGSTVGNLALALTATRENQKVIVNRNCHRSVISGLTLTGAIPVWVMPDMLDDWGVYGAITPPKIEELLEQNPDAKLVWITNPTYEGVVSDIEAISKICKERDVTLIVDEAHGCLWNFNEKLPKPALSLGADAVVHSLHKTGGSFSQSSVLHIGKNSKINKDEVEANLKMLQSTSPSYMLLASIDGARAYLSTERGLNKLDVAINNANIIRSKLSGLPKVKCLTASDDITIDPTKIYIQIEGLSGKRLESILEFEYHIEVEAATDIGILALSNIGNSKEDLEYFWESIKSIVNSNFSDITYLDHTKYMPFHTPEMVYTPRKAYIDPKEKVSPKRSVGKICAEVIAVCPPGIPVLVPGERITAEHLPYLTPYESIWVTKEN